RIGALVEPALARRPPLEVLYDVRHESLLTVDPGFCERPVEDLAGRTDKRVTGEVLLVARLLTDQHHSRVGRSLAEDSLGRPLPEVAPSTAGGKGSKVVEATTAAGHGEAHLGQPIRIRRWRDIPGHLAAMDPELDGRGVLRRRHGRWVRHATESP